MQESGARDHAPAALAYSAYANGVKFTKAHRLRGYRRRGEWRVHSVSQTGTIIDRFTTEMDMSVQVESEDQEDIVVNTPSKRRTRAMRIVDYDEESVAEEEEDEMDEEEEDAEGVSIASRTARFLLNHPRSNSQKRMSWNPTRNRNIPFLLPQG